MEKHVTVVGVLNIVYRSVAILVAGVLLVLAGLFGNIFEELVMSGAIQPHEVPIEILDFIPVILIVVAGIIVIVSVVGIIGAVGVLQRKEWGRIVLLVISFFNLMRIPLGTILAIYSIWVLLNNDTVRLFNPVRTS